MATNITAVYLAFTDSTSLSLAGRSASKVRLWPYAFAFCCFLTFAQRNFCAFAIFLRPEADLVHFLGCPFEIGSVPASSRMTAMALSNLVSFFRVCPRSPRKVFSVPAKSRLAIWSPCWTKLG